MERAVQSDKDNQQQSSAASSARRSLARSYAPRSSRLGQLADNINNSPQVQRLAQMQADIQRSRPVQRLQQIAEPIQPDQPAQLEEQPAPAPNRTGLPDRQVVQRMLEKKGDAWVEKTVDFTKLTPDEVKDIRDNIWTAFSPAGKYKLSSEEVKKLNARESELQKSPEAQKLREQKALEDDVAARQRLEVHFKQGKKWTFVGTPTHMGASGSHKFLQNWEAAFIIEGQRGVLHLHFNTDKKEEISPETLGKGHIKTFLESKAGNFDAPKEMEAQATKAVQELVKGKPDTNKDKQESKKDTPSV